MSLSTTVDGGCVCHRLRLLCSIGPQPSEHGAPFFKIHATGFQPDAPIEGSEEASATDPSQHPSIGGIFSKMILVAWLPELARAQDAHCWRRRYLLLSALLLSSLISRSVSERNTIPRYSSNVRSPPRLYMMHATTPKHHKRAINRRDVKESLPIRSHEELQVAKSHSQQSRMRLSSSHGLILASRFAMSLCSGSARRPGPSYLTDDDCTPTRPSKVATKDGPEATSVHEDGDGERESVLSSQLSTCSSQLSGCVHRSSRPRTQCPGRRLAACALRG